MNYENSENNIFEENLLTLSFEKKANIAKECIIKRFRNIIKTPIREDIIPKSLAVSKESELWHTIRIIVSIKSYSHELSEYCLDKISLLLAHLVWENYISYTENETCDLIDFDTFFYNDISTILTRFEQEVSENNDRYVDACTFLCALANFILKNSAVYSKIKNQYNRESVVSIDSFLANQSFNNIYREVNHIEKVLSDYTTKVDVLAEAVHILLPSLTSRKKINIYFTDIVKETANAINCVKLSTRFLRNP